MALDRKMYEDRIPESELQHRFAHTLLTPRGLYQMWTEGEVYKDQKVPVDIVVPYAVPEGIVNGVKKVSHRKARFRLMSVTFYDAEDKAMKLFYYEYRTK